VHSDKNFQVFRRVGLVERAPRNSIAATMSAEPLIMLRPFLILGQLRVAACMSTICVTRGCPSLRGHDTSQFDSAWQNLPYERSSWQCRFGGALNQSGTDLSPDGR